MLKDLVLKTRSYRRFDAQRPITDRELYEMVDAARLSGSAANRQRIRFALVNDKDTCDKIFSNVAFAGYLKEWSGPTETERPLAYIVMMCKEENIDTSLAIDMGIVAEAILLTATELGLGGCMIRSFKKAETEAILKREGYNAAFVIALGKPAEKVYITSVKDGDIKYYRDENDDHAVPKLSLGELII
jgi:nitroreductase